MPEPSSIVRRIPQATSVRYNTRVYELKRRGEDVIVLSLGEAFFDLPRPTLEGLPHPAMFHYSHSRGLPELRERIAASYRRFGVEADPEREILITAGSKAAIHFALTAILEPGEEVVIPEPAWVSYPEQARLAGGVPVMVPHDVGIGSIGSFVTRRTKLLVVNNPNNPTGRVYAEDELAALLALARARDAYLLADEAYSDFAEPGAFRSAARLDPARRHVLVCNSISKNFGLSGWRIGYVIAGAPLIDEILKINQHVVTCAPTVLQQYVAAHFDEILARTAPQIARLLEKRGLVAEMLAERGLEALPGAAAFYFFVRTSPSGLGSEAFATRLLEEERISVVPGIGYGPSCDAFVRISIGAEPLDRIEGALDRVRDLIDETSSPAAGDQARIHAQPARRA